MKFDDKIIKEILLKEHYLTEEDIQKAEAVSKNQRQSFTEYLLQELSLLRVWWDQLLEIHLY